MKTLGLKSNLTYNDKGFLTALTDSVKITHEISLYAILGRAHDNQIVISDTSVSNRHARIERRDDGFYIRDLKSKNGTFVNSMQVIEAKLRAGDRIRLGITELQFNTEKGDEYISQLLKSNNKIWNEQLERIPAMAASPHSVLIMGPSGSGKEVLANLFHKLSSRAEGPFISVNCATLTESLAESELFGHRKGSFTGATDDRKGAFQSAEGGTLFLDEIGEMPLGLQPKFLRALENNEVKAVGSDKIHHTNIRIIAATNKNLQQLVTQKKFREDLYYRLHVLHLNPPALNERTEDFDSLFHYFTKNLSVRFTPESINKLKNYSWPGNIRELKNVIARASALFDNSTVTSGDVSKLLDLQENPFEGRQSEPSPVLVRDYLREYEREAIIQKLTSYYGNQRAAARELGIAKSTLNDRLRRYKIDPLDYKKKWPKMPANG